MSQDQSTTQNIVPQNKDLEVLKKHFPHCFDKNGDFDFEKFKKELSNNEINFSKESYAMDWLGRSYARLLATDPTKTLLKEDKIWNNKPENKNSENLLIKGDNLEVLKHLSNAYYEAVKMIYIDPPYNTGSDGFVYEDDRKFTPEEFSELAGVNIEQAKKVLSFVNSKNNSHSAWLTFMYPRLYIAKQLLKDEGVIFVSIDDSEVAQLRLLMNEIFGEENFISDLIWKNKKGGGNDSKFIAVENEHIIFYAKSSNNLDNLFHQYSEEYIKRYKEEDKDGLFFWDTFKRKSGKQYYKITCPDGTILENDEFGSPISWLRSETTFRKDLESGEIRIVKVGAQWSVQFKQRLPKGKKPRSILDSYGTTSTGSDECLNLFQKNIFDNPKPTNLIKHFLDITTDYDDIILDFFGGSGTTGDAVIQLNKEDKVNGKESSRKYILIQIPEVIHPIKKKVAYDFVKNELGISEPTIFDITKERLIRASKKIQDENIDLPAKSIKEKCSGIDNEHCSSCKGEHTVKLDSKNAIDLSEIDLGFKIFETAPIWKDYEFKEKEFSPQSKLFDESKLSDEDIQTLLTTWKTYDNIPLTQALEIVNLDGYTGYYRNRKLYMMNKGFETKNLKVLIEKIDTDTSFNPVSIIVFGYHFESKMLREIAENISSYTNKKKLDIDFITRY